MVGAVSVYNIIDAVTTVSGIPLALAGFGVTFWQAREAKRAAEQARDAAESTRDRLIRSSLISLIHQLAKTEEELDQAVRDGESGIAISWINTWKWQASQAKGLIKASNNGEQKVLKALQTSIIAAGEAKNTLISNPSDLVSDTASVRSAIVKVTGEIGHMVASLGFEIGD
jgi:PIN domain nuclease of toxin-antitoxin system